MLRQCFILVSVSLSLIFANTEHKQDTPVNIDRSWYSSVSQDIEQSEYHISKNGPQGALQSPNRAQNLRILYSHDGFFMKPRIDSTGKWGIELKLRSISKGTGAFYPLSAEKAVNRLDDNKLIVKHTTFDIEYVNDKKGMRQNFVVYERPIGNGMLSVNLVTKGSLVPIKKGTGDVLFADKNEKLGNYQNKVWYKDLKCWDSNGKELSSSVKVDGNHIALVVNDFSAQYPVTIDPLSTTEDWKVEDSQEESFFGYSVSSVGDVNGDGYSDVIIGACEYENGQSNEGKVFVYYGSSSGLSSTADWTAESNQAYARFGCSVSSAGDVNGDGYNDVIIGVKYYTNGQSLEGGAFVYYGSSTGLSSTADWTAESNQASALFGYSVSGAGDVNGDGYSDVMVGALQYENGQSSEGGAFVYYGSSSGLSSTADWSAESNQAGSRFGYSVSSAGDVNGDGYSDVMVGAYLYDNGETDEGKAYVYYGSPSGLSSTADWTKEGDQDGAQFGHSVSRAGDVNGDGYSDVMVGAIGYANGELYEGGAFVYYGSSSGLSSTADWTAESNQAASSFGYSVSCAGDVNGDGYSDVIVSAPEYDNSKSNQGRAFFYYGSSSGPSSAADWTAEGEESDAYFGASVSSAGDVNGDGYSDVIVGSYNYIDEPPEEPDYDKKVYVYHGSPSGLASSPIWTGESDQADASYGYSVSSAGDVNGDGYSDVIVGAYLYDNGETKEGRSFVYHGSSSGLSTTADWTAESNRAYARFGRSVSSAGDVNGDGYGDVIVGAKNYDNGEAYEGMVFIYFGSASGLSSAADWTAEGNQAEAYFGYSVSSAGDVNGDGYGDVIVGAKNYDNGETDEGRAFVYYGSSSGPSLAADWTAESDQASAYFGISVSSAGDVNGDGYSDVVVGAKDFDNGETDEGRAFVYYGSSSGPSSTADWTAESNQSESSFGISVSSAGDVNGDGYSDIVIGAHRYDNGQNDEGRAFIYYGSSAGPSSAADWTAESNQADAYFGFSVSSAGDVNGDGYSDIIIGAYWYDNGQSNEGRAFAYYGSSSGPSTTADWTAESNQASAYFGISVSSAGDVNGDGYSDVIAGAQYYDNGQSDEGAAFVYYGNNRGGLRSNAAQYQNDLSTIMAPGGMCGTENQAGLGLFAKSFMGRQKGQLVYEYAENGSIYSGTPVTTSTGYTGISSAYTDMVLTGTELKESISGLTTNRTYKWRARVMYDPVTSITGQVYGPWRYMPNEHIHEGGFRSTDMSAVPAPSLVSPSSNSIDIDVDTTLIWNSSASESFVSYNLRISTTSDFATTVLDTSGLNDTAMAVVLDDGMEYFWKVSVTDDDGIGEWSDVWSFTTLFINNAPLIDAVSDPVAIMEEAGMQTIYMTGISGGDPHMQSIILDAVTSDVSLIPTPKVLYTSGNAAGYLQYTPVANANGTATISVKVQDDGGTENNGIDTTIITFDVEVTPVNDAPSFTPGSDQTIEANAGSQAVTAWATDISAGPANESGQTLAFTVTTNNDALFESLPAIDATGELTYTAADDSTGSAVVSVRLKDDGGTTDGGIDSTATVQFTITVEPVNIAPVITSATTDTAHRTVPYYYTVIADDPGDTLTYALTDHPAWLHIGGPVVYGSPPDSALTDTSFTVIVTDGELSDTVTVQLAILPGDGKVPVDLASFTAVEQNGAVLLEWTTQSEIGNLGWDVRRSGSPAGPFQVITGSIVPGAGSTQQPQAYSFTDTTAGTGLWYYQLVQYDVNGDRQFSYTVAVYVEATGIVESGSGNPFGIRVKNPAGAVDMTFDARYAGTVRVLVTDVQGRVVAVGMPSQAAYHTSGLEPGIYYVTLDDGGSRETVKVLLIK